jgi:hypothetical protein
VRHNVAGRRADEGEDPLGPLKFTMLGVEGRG